jgi:hypothetical protein
MRDRSVKQLRFLASIFSNALYRQPLKMINSLLFNDYYVSPSMRATT